MFNLGSSKRLLLNHLLQKFTLPFNTVNFPQKFLPFFAVFVITSANVQAIQSSWIRTLGPVSQLFSVHNSAGRNRTHTLFEKSRARNSRCCDWPSSLMRAGIYYGTAVTGSRCCGIPARNKNLRNKNKSLDRQHDNQDYQCFIRIKLHEKIFFIFKDSSVS